MFRHGARSPLDLDLENKDIFGNKWDGKGELTAVGMRMHFLLGYRNSEVYGKALNITKYSTSEISITSTDVNRTILSAYSQLQGFFPPLTGPQLNEAQKQVAFPPIEYDFSPELVFLKDNALREQANVFAIKTMNKADHEFYLHDADVCEGVKAKIAAAKQSDKIQTFVKQFNKNYAEKVYKVLNKTEQNFNLSEVEKLETLFDTFMSAYTDGRQFPAFAAQNLSLSEFYNVSSEFLYIDMFDIYLSDDYTGLYSMSPLFGKILNYMDRRIQSEVNNITVYTNKDPKIAMVSGHDTNLAAFLRFVKAVFNKTELVNPTYASSVYVELLYDPEVSSEIPVDKFFVNMSINEENLFGGPIKYSYFADEVRKRLVKSDEIAKFCNFQASQSSANNALLIAVISLGALSVFLLIWFMVIMLRKKNSSEYLDSEGFQPVIS
jgi:Txe/YoeB family toxin of Txe-Axe toxin-antitoxin module